MVRRNWTQINADFQDKKIMVYYLKKQKKLWGWGNLRISEKICVLIKNWTRMNTDLQDKEKFSFLKNRKKVWGDKF